MSETLLLSKRERKLIEQIVYDEQQLIPVFGGRTKEYWKMQARLIFARNKVEENRTDVERQICEYAVACENGNKYIEFYRKYGTQNKKKFVLS